MRTLLMNYRSQSAEAAFFRLRVSTEPSPEPGIFALSKDHSQGRVSVSLLVMKPQFLVHIDDERNRYTVTVSTTMHLLGLGLYLLYDLSLLSVPLL